MSTHRIAFYPCCGTDILEPIRILKGLADEIIFCDINERLEQKWATLVPPFVSQDLTVRAVTFSTGDARQVVQELDRIDVLFYRNDSNGEGGSALYVLSKWFLPTVLERVPAEGGLIITDGSNSSGRLFRKMKREAGVRRFGKFLRPAEHQPFLTQHGLWTIRVSPDNDYSD